MSAGAQLRAIRERVGVTQNQLATRMGKSHSFVWNVEQDRRRLTARDTIQAWAEALSVSTDEIYRAIGIVPHDIAEALATADPATWDEIRQVIQRGEEEE